MGIYGWDNLPEENREQIDRLREKLKACVGTRLAGIYLHGSLALNSFNPALSDLDVIVLLNEGLDMDMRYELVKVLLALSNHPSAIEISFITMNAIWPWSHPTAFQLHSSEIWREQYEEQVAAENKKFWAKTQVDGDLACHLTLINQKGICVYGKPIQEVFPQVPEEDLRSSIVSDVPYAVRALTAMPLYGILTLCRILSYLETGMLFSKVEAGEWVLPLLPTSIRYIVEQAVQSYLGDGKEKQHFADRDLEQYKNQMLSAINGHLIHSLSD